tara:strand:+ start:267 stop:914 length:648 start_codon:yes stop_codon:yes gene_type:complete
MSTAENIARQLDDVRWMGMLSFTGWGEPLMNKKLFDIIDLMPKRCKTRITTNGDILYKNPKMLETMLLQKIDVVYVSIYDGQEQYDMFEKVWGQYDNIELRPLEDREPNFNNRGGAVDVGKEARSGDCYIPFYKMFIDVDGTIRLCCNDWQRKKGYGKNIVEAWNKLDRIYDGKRNFPPCDDCSVNGTLEGRDSFVLRMKMKGNYVDHTDDHLFL